MRLRSDFEIKNNDGGVYNASDSTTITLKQKLPVEFLLTLF